MSRIDLSEKLSTQTWTDMLTEMNDLEVQSIFSSNTFLQSVVLENLQNGKITIKPRRDYAKVHIIDGWPLYVKERDDDEEYDSDNSYLTNTTGDGELMEEAYSMAGPEELTKATLMFYDKDDLVKGDIIHFTIGGEQRNMAFTVWDGEQVLPFDFDNITDYGHLPSEIVINDFPRIDYFMEALYYMEDTVWLSLKGYSRGEPVVEHTEYGDNYKIIFTKIDKSVSGLPSYVVYGNDPDFGLPESDTRKLIRDDGEEVYVVEINGKYNEFNY